MLDAATFPFARGETATSLADAPTRDSIFAGDSKHGSLPGPASANQRWKLVNIHSHATSSFTSRIYSTKKKEQFC